MARSIDEINITNWQNLGTTTSIERRSFDIEVKWTRNDGTKGTHSSTRTFPGALSTMPLSVLRHFVESMIIAVVRVELDIDTWDNY